MAIFEVAIERKIDIKMGILAQICGLHGKYREYTPLGLQTPRLIVIVTNSPPTSTIIIHIPISLYIDNYICRLSLNDN